MDAINLIGRAVSACGHAALKSLTLQNTDVESVGVLAVRATNVYVVKNFYNSYYPNKAACLLFLVLYGLTWCTHIFQYIRNFRSTKFFWPILVAGAMQTFGYLTRFLSSRNVYSKGLYIAQFGLVVIAPLLTAAALYILLGQLMAAVLPGGRKAKLLKIQSRFITLLFCLSDLFSIGLQGCGAGFMSGNSDGKDPAKLKLGSKIMLIGLAVQLCFFTFFTVILTFFDRTTKAMYAGQKRPRWRFLIWASYLACVLILIRSIYRVVEFAQGWTGYLASFEVYFYCFESLPMLPTLVIFNIFHPKILTDWVKDKESSAVSSDGETGAAGVAQSQSRDGSEVEDPEKNAKMQ